MDRTENFPEIVATIANLKPTTLLLDGEIVVFDRSRVSRFQLLQQDKGHPFTRSSISSVLTNSAAPSICRWALIPVTAQFAHGQISHRTLAHPKESPAFRLKRSF
jgi:hypothetical protein